MGNAVQRALAVFAHSLCAGKSAAAVDREEDVSIPTPAWTICRLTGSYRTILIVQALNTAEPSSSCVRVALCITGTQC